MVLPYPITSYASRHVDLTGGRLAKFEDILIRLFGGIFAPKRRRYEDDIMTAEEMKALGLTQDDLGMTSKNREQ